MNSPRVSSRRRETFLALFLTLAFGCAITLFFFMISNRLLFALLAVSVAMILLGCLQYLLWGWPMMRSRSPNIRPEDASSPPSSDAGTRPIRRDSE